MDVTTRTLPVPGATLHYEVRGSGPVLLLICGGVYDAAGFAPLAADLADAYTVVTYDRRGNSRSPLAGAPELARTETHADDAAALLAAVGVTPERPAAVFGNSSGAQIGLSLAERHPELVRTVLAHEPPTLYLLPEAAHWKSVIAQVREAYATGGAFAAMRVFSAAFAPADPDTPEALRTGGADDGGAEDVGAEDVDAGGVDAGGAGAAVEPADPEVAAARARQLGNLDVFAGYEIPGFADWAPDVDALLAAGARIVLGVGAGSVGEPPHRAALVVAEMLGVEPVTFPGDHGGFGNENGTFATRLKQELTA